MNIKSDNIDMLEQIVETSAEEASIAFVVTMKEKTPYYYSTMTKEETIAILNHVLKYIQNEPS